MDILCINGKNGKLFCYINCVRKEERHLDLDLYHPGKERQSNGGKMEKKLLSDQEVKKNEAFVGM